MQSVLTHNICIDLQAFLQNDDGTWTVLEDTMVRSDATEHAHTLLLPGGTRINSGMFSTNDIDLVKVLELASERENKSY